MVTGGYLINVKNNNINNKNYIIMKITTEMTKGSMSLNLSMVSHSTFWYSAIPRISAYYRKSKGTRFRCP